MVNKKDDNTEHRILEAATRIFYQKGLDGARMQEIADAAGINKAMLHYYFRSKDQLFERIFLNALAEVVPKLAEYIGADISLEEKFEKISEFYHNLLLENPMLPVFVFQTVQRDPNIILDYIREKQGINPPEHMMKFFMQMQAEIEAGNIAPVDPRHVLLNLISMSVFPFLMKPIFTRVIGQSDEEFESFVTQRKTQIPLFMKSMLKPE